jgi:predicted Ser/Thr protein kinase
MSNENSSREIVYTQDEVIIKDIYILKNKEKIGGGSFGQIYKGYNKKSGKKLAIKMELNTAKTPLLQTEYKILKTLQGNVGFTNVYYFSSIGEDKIMIMDLLGQNLENLMKNNSARCLSLKSVLMCAEQMVIYNLFKINNSVI